MWFCWASVWRIVLARILYARLNADQQSIILYSEVCWLKQIFFSSLLLLESPAIATAFASRLVRHGEPLEQTGSGRTLQAAGPRLWRDGRRQEAPGLLGLLLSSCAQDCMTLSLWLLIAYVNIFLNDLTLQSLKNS